MSGGHFNYVGGRIDNDLAAISEDADVLTRWPLLAELLDGIRGWIVDTEHVIDWDLSADKAIPVPDAVFERRAIVQLLELAMKAAPDDLFPRGKWATIQAIQERGAR